jgi:hypothetical protein
MRGATMDRYALFGVIAQERDVNERIMDYDEQNVGDSGGTLIYETNDLAEAKAIYEAGGFEKDGKWHVVTRYEDRGRTAGDRVLNKGDFA